VNIKGYQVVLYDGLNGAVLSKISLDTATKTGTGAVKFAVLNFATGGIQNGPDGIALVTSTNALVQFLSYEGTISATDGPASGITSSNIEVLESGSPVDSSLQLSGNGCGYALFIWARSAANTKGRLNNNQIICGEVCLRCHIIAASS
jgi:uncharacterized protein